MKRNIFRMFISCMIFIIIEILIVLRFGITKPSLQLQENIEEEHELIEKSAGEPINFYIGEWMNMRASKYCACNICCYPYSTGTTASGVHVQANHTIAAPSWLAFGTWVEIESDIPGVSGFYKVEDRGGAIKGDRLDIYVDNHNEADAFGIHPVKMRIVSENLTKY